MKSFAAAPKHEYHTHAVPKARWEARRNDVKMSDIIVNGGLWDAFYHYYMGITVKNVKKQWHLTCEEIDEFAVRSQNKAEAATKAGRFKDEIVP